LLVEGSAVFGGAAPRACRICLVRLSTDGENLSPQRRHALDLDRAGIDVGEDSQWNAALARRVRHALSEIACGRTDEWRVIRPLVDEELGPAALERADRDTRLELEHELAAEEVVERIGFELWGIAKTRLDNIVGGGDVLDGEER